MEFLLDIADFVVKAAILVFAVIIVIAMISNAAQRQRKQEGTLQVDHVSDDLRTTAQKLRLQLLDKRERKQAQKVLKKEQKKRTEAEKDKVFVIEFKGSMDAKEVENLAREVNAVVSLASKGDKVLVRLESPGGVVHGYGLGAAQLQRLRDAGLEIIVSVDKVAASGGYMMAAVAHHIQAAPFAIIGSIGVLAQLPNFHRWLKKHEVDFEQVTAGEFKRTLTIFGENTDAARHKFKEELESIHQQFKQHIQEFRPDLDIDKVATGEYWTAQEAQKLGLVDSIGTGDAWLLDRCDKNAIYRVKYVCKKPIGERIGKNINAVLGSVKEFVSRGG